MSTSPGARRVYVAPRRLAAWLAGFAQRHGQPEVLLGPQLLTLSAPDGATAAIGLDWGPLPGADPIGELVASAAQERLVAALIVRKRAHAVGVFAGEALLVGRHHGHYVQGRTKAGGWSQRRYARRRADQAGRAFDAAADDAADILVPRAGEVAGLVAGGDTAAVAAVLAYPELARLRCLPRIGPVLAVPDPNATVLAGFGELLRRVRIDLNSLA